MLCLFHYNLTTLSIYVLVSLTNYRLENNDSFLIMLLYRVGVVDSTMKRNRPNSIFLAWI